MTKTTITNIVSHKACIGCGLCEAVAKNEGCHMELVENGFYLPKGEINLIHQSIIKKICPGKNVRVEEYGSVWGVVRSIHDGWATDHEVRQQGSSGGVISAICIELLESKTVSAVLHVGCDPENPKFNLLQLSRTKEEILNRCSSRYAPAEIFTCIEDYLQRDESYAFVGKPCDITALKAYLEVYPQYKSKIKVFLSFFCAGIPSYVGTDQLLDPSKKLISLKYRGNGWPGFFTAKYDDGTESKVSYEKSWGEVLGQYVHYRCKICPDGIGLAADIVAADSWNTKDGYPDFEEQEGKNFIVVRSKIGEDVLNQCVIHHAIRTESLNVIEISSKQPYQYSRRRQLSWRILGVQLASQFFFQFRNIGVLRNLYHINPIKGIRVCVGSIKRYFAK